MNFPVDYFKKEVRCSFEISEMMKRAWAAEMEVMQVIIDICEKNHLQYFADSGTLLGAVRHEGFIPWDDDIDIALKREQYNELVGILPRELPHGFVMAGMYADTKRLQDAAFVPHVRVMADETIWSFNDYMQYFHGFPYQRVGIDIFPLDYIPRNPEAAKIQGIILRQGITLLRDWESVEQSVLTERITELETLCNMKFSRDDDIKNRIWRVLDAVCALYGEEESDELTNYPFWINQDTFRLKKEWYEDVTYLPFEHMKIAAPCGYDGVLTAVYGDYMTPQQYVAAHDYPFYGHMEDELKRQIKAVGFTGSVEEFCELMSKGKLRV